MGRRETKKGRKGKLVHLRRWVREREGEDARSQEKPPSPFTGLYPFKRREGPSPGMARILRTVVENRGRLLEEDPWVPFPQNSCTFLFGARRAPLPLGALVLLWDRWPAATGWCPLCGEKVYAVGFGGLLSTGGVVAFCAGCGARYYRPVGGLGSVAACVRPILFSTEFWLSSGFFGGTAPGPVRPLLRLLRRLGIPLAPRAGSPPAAGPVPWPRHRPPAP
ncbi:MAG: hypothetical protein ACP5VN_08885 [Acidobacteriota bacterium]